MKIDEALKMDDKDFKGKPELSPKNDAADGITGDIICIDSDLAKKVLAALSSQFTGEYNSREIIDYIESKQTGEYMVKRFLQKICDLLFVSEKAIKDRLHDLFTEQGPDLNFEFAKNKLYIDNINYYGKTPEEEPIQDFFDEGDDFEGNAEEEPPIPVINFYEPSKKDKGPDDIVQADDEEDEEEEIDEEDDPIEEDDSLSFDAKNLPDDLSSAQRYYNNIKDKILLIDNYESIYFDSSVNNKICKGTDITTNDNIELTIEFNKEDKLNTGICLVVNSNDKVVILGSLINSANSNQYLLEARSENVDFDSMLESSMYYKVVVFNKNSTAFYACRIDLDVANMKDVNLTLCIDFGTSNTTAGTYTNDGIKIVNYTDVTNEWHSRSCLCPTLVYVNKITTGIGNEPDVEYLFGYDAKKVLIDHDYNPPGDLFFEIKRWILTPNKYEEICDGISRTGIKRKEIIKAYLHYILRCAENDLKYKFKKLHFSAPIKLKSDFIAFVKENVFTAEEGFDVLNADESIDEGIAIVYNHISNNLLKTDREKRNEKESDVYESDKPDKEENIIIIDCGGGTTDLASCHYSYKRNETAYELKLETKFENGNSNFGGNNITFRIFELLKIKIADFYSGKCAQVNLDHAISKLINSNQNDVLDSIDDAIKKKKPIDIYEKLNEESKKSEEILPTDFNGESEYARKAGTRQLIKRNFYYLWQLAEKIKIEFFTRTDIISISLAENDSNDTIQIDPQNLYFYIKNPNTEMPPLKSTRDLAGFAKLPQIKVNTNEIATLLRPDIYYLLATLFFFDTGNNSDYNRMKDIQKISLSGQSCKINLFQDLLKEFIPGHRLRLGKSYTYESIMSEEFKMDCVKGCIAYIRDKDFHAINAKNIVVSQNLTCDVFLSRGGTGIMESALFKATDFRNENGICKASPIHIEKYDAGSGVIRISVFNTVGAYEKEKDINVSMVCDKTKKIVLDGNSDTKTLKEKIIEYAYNNIEDYYIFEENTKCENVIDKLINDLRQVDVSDGKDKLLVFALPNSDGYGFILYQILKTKDINQDEEYYETACTRYPFESGILSKSFFNGCNFVSSNKEKDDKNA